MPLKPVLDNSPVAYCYNSSVWLPGPYLVFQISQHYPFISISGLTGFISLSQRSMFFLPASFPHIVLSACDALLPALPTFLGEFYFSFSSQLKYHFLQKALPDFPMPVGAPCSVAPFTSLGTEGTSNSSISTSV